MKASWAVLEAILDGLEGDLGRSWRHLGGVLEAMLNQDRPQKAQDAKTLKTKKNDVFWPPAEVSRRHLGGVLEATLSHDEPG